MQRAATKLIDVRELAVGDVGSNAKNLNWKYEQGSQSGPKLHHVLIQSIISNQNQNIFINQIFRPLFIELGPFK